MRRVGVAAAVVAFAVSACGPVSRRSRACVAFGEWVQCHYAGREFVVTGRPAKARDMYRRACGRGFSGACISLALLYEAGIGGDHLPDEALRLMNAHCDPVKTACVAPVEPYGGVKAEWTRQTFPVIGKNVKQVFADIERQQPDGKVAWIAPDMEVTFDSKMVAGETRCAAHNFEITLSLPITYPEWSDRPARENDTTREWDDILRRISLHEHSHAYIAIRGANKLLRKLERFGTGRTCQELRESLQGLFNVVQEEVDQAQAAYDRAAKGHGAWIGYRP